MHVSVENVRVVIFHPFLSLITFLYLRFPFMCFPALLAYVRYVTKFIFDLT